MARIPFALFPFPDPARSAEAIERRLRRHLAKSSSQSGATGRLPWPPTAA